MMSRHCLTILCAVLVSVASVAAQVSKSERPARPVPSTCTGGILNAKAVHLPAPLYPREARTGISANVITVMVEVNEKGNVISARACSGHAILRRSAEDAARQARIKPTELSGVPVKVKGVLNYRFNSQTSYTDPVSLYCGPSMKIIKVLNGYAIDLIKPDRPQNSDKIGTAVSVRVTIDENGKVEKAEAVSGDQLFRPNAEVAVKRSTFRRFIRCGKPTKIMSIVTYNFPRP